MKASFACLTVALCLVFVAAGYANTYGNINVTAPWPVWWSTTSCSDDGGGYNYMEAPGSVNASITGMCHYSGGDQLDMRAGAWVSSSCYAEPVQLTANAYSADVGHFVAYAEALNTSTFRILWQAWASVFCDGYSSTLVDPSTTDCE